MIHNAPDIAFIADTSSPELKRTIEAWFAAGEQLSTQDTPTSSRSSRFTLTGIWPSRATRYTAR